AVKHLALHQNEAVRHFANRYVKPMQERIKEPIYPLFPLTFQEIKTVTDALLLLERILREAQRRNTDMFSYEDGNELTPMQELKCSFYWVVAPFFGFGTFYPENYAGGSRERDQLEKHTKLQITRLE